MAAYVCHISVQAMDAIEGVNGKSLPWEGSNLTPSDKNMSLLVTHIEFTPAHYLCSAFIVWSLLLTIRLILS